MVRPRAPAAVAVSRARRDLPEIPGKMANREGMERQDRQEILDSWGGLLSVPRRLPRLASPAQLGHQDHRERKELLERLEPQDRQDGVELMVSLVTKESRARLDHPGSRDSKECPESREPLPRKKAAPSRESPDRPERRDLKAPQENQELQEMTAVPVSFSLFQLIIFNFFRPART